MDELTKFFARSIVAIVGIFLMVIMSTLMGAFAGWVVGFFFSETILGILAQLGVHNIALWQYGAFMGFTGGFLKTKVTVTEK